MKLSVIIVSFNTRELLAACLNSIYGMSIDGLAEIIVVDNSSNDGSSEMLAEKYPEVRTVLNDVNVGFGVANNQGMKIARGRNILLLNSDTIASQAAIEECLDYLDNNQDIGVLGCRLEKTDGSTELSCGRFFKLIHAVFGCVQFNRILRKIGFPKGSPFEYVIQEQDLQEITEVDWIVGAFMLLRRDVYEQTRGFDEKMFLYGEDHEWCYRIKQRGWKIIYYRNASIIHIGKASGSSLKRTERNIRIIAGREYYFRKNFGSMHSILYRNLILLTAIIKLPLYWLLSIFKANYKDISLYNLSVVQWYFGAKVM